MAGTGLQDAVDLLVSEGTKANPSPRVWDFQILPPARPGPTVAVDGSHAVLLDNGAVWVVAIRAAATSWPQPPRNEVPVRYHAALAETAPAKVEAEFHRRGLAPPRIAGADGWAEAWRSLAELDAALEAIPAMPPGALLLVDGALVGLPPHAQAMADRIRAAAGRHAVEVAGLAKRSGLSQSGAPLLPDLLRAGPREPWCVEVEPGVYAAKLHARSPHAFRIDASGPELVARLVPLARDAGYAGYPYPLALAHNRVAITVAHATALKGWMANAVRRTGGADAARLVADFHDVLDRGVP